MVVKRMTAAEGIHVDKTRNY